MIYVTLGTMFLGFNRLVEAVDALARQGGEQVIVQLGNASRPPAYCAWFDFLPHGECLQIQRHARVIIGHAGIGTAIDALSVKRPFIVVPRLKRFNEHMNDHQLEIAEAVQRRGWGRMVTEMGALADACAHPPEVPRHYRPNKAPLIHSVKSMVARVAADRCTLP